MRNSIKKVDLKIDMNQGKLIAHLLSLGLYLLATVMFYIAFYKVQKNPQSVVANIKALRVWDVDTVFNFISQMVLCCLFWLLGTPKTASDSLKETENLLATI